MKNALILHGTNGSSKENWFPWLKEELEKRGYKVWVPDLPGADRPNIKRYNEFIFSNSDWEFNEESTLVGHSSGSLAVLGVLQDLPDGIVVKHATLVAGFKDDLGWANLGGLFEKPFDWEKIKRSAKRITLIHSDNDPHIPLEHGEYLKEKLDAELVVMPGRFHFNTEHDPKFTKFPEIIKFLY